MQLEAFDVRNEEKRHFAKDHNDISQMRPMGNPCDLPRQVGTQNFSKINYFKATLAWIN